MPFWINLSRRVLGVLATALILMLVLYILGRFFERNVAEKSYSMESDISLSRDYNSRRQAILDYKEPPVFTVDIDYANGNSKSWWPKGESPILSELVSEGKLPPVIVRVGPEPAVYQGAYGIGKYGGDWWRLAEDIDPVRVSLQYELANTQFIRYSPYGEPYQYHLAKKIEPNNDYTAYKVELRHGVRWSDGVPFTAEDIIWWWENVNKNNDVGFISGIMRADGNPGSIEKIDEYTLLYRFPVPNPGWLDAIASAGGAVMMAGPRHYLEQFHPSLGDRKLIENICSSEMLTPKALFQEKNHPLNPERPKLGPWIFRRYSSKGPWTAVRNPYYFAVDMEGNQLPYLDRIVFQQVGTAMQAKAVTDGLTSLTHVTLDSDYSSLMSCQETGKYIVRHWTPESRGTITVVPNRAKSFYAKEPVERRKAEFLETPRFRRAMSISINRQTIIDAELKGIGSPASLGPPPWLPWYDAKLVKANTEYDPEEAGKILDELGLDRRDPDGFREFSDGARLTLTLITHPGQTGPFQFMVQDWAAVGLRVILLEKPHRLYLRAAKFADLEGLTVCDYDELSYYALGAGKPAQNWYWAGGLYGMKESEQFAPPGRIEEQAMRLGVLAGNTRNTDERLRAAREVMKIASEHVWTINVSTPQPVMAVVKNGLKGVPDKLLFSSHLCSPNNGCPETWYWDNPDTINGSVPASEEYLKERKESIKKEILTPVLAPSRCKSSSYQAEPGAANFLGRFFRLLAIGILLSGLSLVALRHKFILHRLALMIPTLLLISIIVFTGVQLPEGSYLDTVIANLEEQGMNEQAQKEIYELKEMYHLDEGLLKSYFRWSGLLWFTSFNSADKGILQGNLGRSMSNDGAFVNDLLGNRLLLTACIALGTVLLTWIIAIPIGIYSAVRQYSMADYALTIGGFIGVCIPQFILALVLMLMGKEVFGITMMGLFSSQYATQEFWDLPKFIDLLKHIWLPILVVAAGGTAGMIRVMRANLLDELKKPYVITARAKGVRPLKLIFKYPLRMALNPFVSGIGQIFPMLISGSAIVEIILSLPTVGPLLLNAVMLEDTYMAGTLLLLVSALSVFGVLISDLLLMLLDPRIRMGVGSK